MGKPTFIVGLVGMVLGAGVFGVSVLLPIVNRPRTSWREAMLGIVPGALCTFAFFVLTLIGLFLTVSESGKRRRWSEEDEPEEDRPAGRRTTTVAAKPRRRILKLALLGATLAFVAAGATGTWYLVWGQGPRLSQVRAEYGPRYDAKREQFKAIAALLPPAGSVQGNSPARGLHPLPEYDAKRREFNTEIIMFEQLLDPDVRLRHPQDFNLMLFEAGLTHCMLALGPKTQLVAAQNDDRVHHSFVERCRKALDLPYLVVVRTVERVPPRVLADRTSTAGSIDLEGFLVDLRTTKLVGSFRVTARVDPVNPNTARGDSTRYQDLEYEAARREVAKALTDISGGTFVFN